MPVSDWADLCVQTLVWQPLTGRDQYGKPTYGAAQTFAGRRVNKITRTTPGGTWPSGAGAEVVSQSSIWILGLPDIKYEDRIYVQGDTVFPQVLSVERYPDENGDLFVKVLLDKAG